MSRPASPQDKKARSLAHDRRNTYGENDKSSRTAIRQRKRQEQRARRNLQREAIHAGDPVDGDVVVPERRGGWRKSADTPLGKLLHDRRERRLVREARARAADDPAFLDRLEAAAVRHGLSEVAARMIVRGLRGDTQPGRRRGAAIDEDTIALLLRVVRRLA